MGQALTVTKSEPLSVVKSEPASAPAPQPQAPTAEDRPWYAPVTDLVTQLQSLNPVALVKGVGNAVSHPVATVQGMGQQNEALFRKAEESFKAGDYATGARHLVSYVLNGVPGLGQRLDEAADDFQAGDYAKGVGKTLDASIATMGPAAVTKVRGVQVPGLGGTRLNPTEQAAVQFGESRGVPMDAATATGRPIVSVVQKRVSDTMGGAGVAEKVKAGQADALARVGGELADAAHRTVVDPVRAGEGVRAAVQDRIRSLHQEASTAYDALRQFEAAAPAQTRAPHPGAPFQSMKLAVDVRPARTALQPLYQQLMREKELVGVLQGGKARALTALDSLMNGPDFAPLSTVDSALGDMKAMARGAEMPELRSGGQAAAAEAVKQLDQQVRATAAQAGPNVIKALEDGRKATVAKYQAADVLETLSTEPRKVFDMLTTRKDGAIERLRAVAKEAPGELPKIGRAYLEDLMTKATAEGGFGHADALFADWQRLGPETKALIFKNPTLVKNVSDFLLLAKRIAANPNPSGTARVLTALNVSSTLPSYALAQLFYSPRGVALLRKGLTIKAGNKTAATAYVAEVSRAIEEGAKTAPAVADSRDQGKKP
jgi:hypothetical protein